MAIDTANKRASVQAYFLGMMRPVPDGAITAPDRVTSGWIYAGLTYSASQPAAAIVPRLWHLPGGYGRQAFKGHKGYSK